jgi:hypothetical protein
MVTGGHGSAGEELAGEDAIGAIDGEGDEAGLREVKLEGGGENGNKR